MPSNTHPPVRCVNIDWLEVYTLEVLPHTPAYFESQGYEVDLRAYGTPQYRQMFTIKEKGHPMLEIRRDPYSLRSEGGIFPKNAAHIRLSNRACYLISPVRYLYNFMLVHGFRYQSISRIDICLDFNRFDDGTNPQAFVLDYMNDRISKINQSNVHAHGSDRWAGRVWNSIKWGAPTSAVSTKLYNKTLELNTGKDKFYIRDAWVDAGLDISHDVWRVEFSIDSQGQSLQDKINGGYVKKGIADYETRHQLLFHWQVLASKYFHFKRLVLDRNGRPQRKDRCPDVPTINIVDPDAETWRPVRNPTQQHEPSRTLKMLVKRLQETWHDMAIDRTIRLQALALSRYYIYTYRMDEFANKQDVYERAERMRQAQPQDLQLTPYIDIDATINHIKEVTERKELALLRSLLAKYGSVGIDTSGTPLPF